ncbi:MAG: hypothetical protein IJ083_15190 [Clostridia bacterium]|nr:hypothetical protein [Clostridia bacterium]
MLKVSMTQNLYGIAISGDYQDMQGLYSALAGYLDFYEENQEDRIPWMDSEFLLSLNYDIRHAIMGDRQFDVEDNGMDLLKTHQGFSSRKRQTDDEMSYSSLSRELNAPYKPRQYRTRERNQLKILRRAADAFSCGALYYKVEFLFPMFLYYLLAYQIILEKEPEDIWSCAIDGEGVLLKAQQDRYLLKFFFSSVWVLLRDFFGPEIDEMEGLMALMFPRSVPTAEYTEFLAYTELACMPSLKPEMRKDALFCMFYEMADMSLIGLYAGKDKTILEIARKLSEMYYTRKERIDRAAGKIVVMSEVDYALFLDNKFGKNIQITRAEYDDFMEEVYGRLPEDDPVM